MSRLDLSSVIRVARGGDPLRVGGVTDLLALRSALIAAATGLGYQIAFDPDSDPTAVDYLAIGTLATLEGAGIGAVIGTAIGALLGDAKAGAVIGTALGAAAGAAHGVRSVEYGVRIRATFDDDGTPVAVVSPLT